MSTKPNTNNTKKITCISVIAILAGVAAVAASVIALKSTYEISQKQAMMESSDIPSLFQMISSGETAQTPESGAQEYKTAEGASLHIIANDGGELAVSKDSVVLIKTQSGKQVGFPVSAFTDNDSEVVLYNSQQGTANIGNYVVSASDGESVGYNTTTFTSGDSKIYTGSASIGPCNVTVAYETTEDFNEENIKNILDAAEIVTGNYDVYLFEQPMNSSWTETFALNDSVAAFSSDTDNVYVSKYNGTLTGAGFDTTVKLTESMSASYSDIKDESSGLSPFFVNTNGFTFKLLSVSPEVLQSMFC